MLLIETNSIASCSIKYFHPVLNILFVAGGPGGQQAPVRGDGPVLRRGAPARHQGLRLQHPRRPRVPQHAALRPQDGRRR